MVVCCAQTGYHHAEDGKKCAGEDQVAEISFVEKWSGEDTDEDGQETLECTNPGNGRRRLRGKQHRFIRVLEYAKRVYETPEEESNQFRFLKSDASIKRRRLMTERVTYQELNQRKCAPKTCKWALRPPFGIPVDGIRSVVLCFTDCFSLLGVEIYGSESGLLGGAKDILLSRYQSWLMSTRVLRPEMLLSVKLW